MRCQVGRHHEQGQEQRQADQHLVRRHLLRADRVADEAQDDGDADETGDHHQDGRHQAEDRQQQEELQRGAVVRTGPAELDLDAWGVDARALGARAADTPASSDRLASASARMIERLELSRCNIVLALSTRQPILSREWRADFGRRVEYPREDARS